MSRLNELIERVHDRVEKEVLFQHGGRYILALSGGADSTLLLHVMDHLSREYGFSLIVASLDHGLRPEAGKDQELVRKQAVDFGLPLHAASVSTSHWKEHGGSPETDARALRFRFLNSVCSAYDANGIVTGHNRTDHMETVLMNINRGTGMRGLTGLLDSRIIIRPLLGLGRDEIRSALLNEGIPFCEDPSNLDTRMLRNRLRRHLLQPMATVFGDGHEESWIRLSLRMRNTRLSLEKLLTDRFGPCMQCKPGAIRILRDSFSGDSVELQHELLLWLTELVTGSTFRMNHLLVEQAVRFIRKDGYGRMRPFRDNTLTVVRSGRWVTLTGPGVEIHSCELPGPGVYPGWFCDIHVGKQYVPDTANPHIRIDHERYPFPWKLEPLLPDDEMMTGESVTRALRYLKKKGLGAFERKQEPVLKCGKIVLLVPELVVEYHKEQADETGSIPVYMDRPMGYNPRRLQKADPIGSDHPKEARKR